MELTKEQLMSIWCKTAEADCRLAQGIRFLEKNGAWNMSVALDSLEEAEQLINEANKILRPLVGIEEIEKLKDKHEPS